MSLTVCKPVDVETKATKLGCGGSAAVKDAAPCAPVAALGDWTKNLAALRDEFEQAKPFEHVTIPNFFSEEYARHLLSKFPDPKDPNYDWKFYNNPIEIKYSLNAFDSCPVFKEAFELLQSQLVVDGIAGMSGIEDLECDPHLHGAGLHAYPRNGKLDIHLDYSIHPVTGKERRLNLIVYMNPTWKQEYGGHLQFLDENMANCTKLLTPGWNTAVLFRTCDVSFHGLPSPLQCPEGDYRRSLAIYYVSPARPGVVNRPKAQYFPYPGQPVDDRLRNLYVARQTRLITSEELDRDWPTWKEDGQGYW